jgi:hypothetical protein
MHNPVPRLHPMLTLAVACVLATLPGCGKSGKTSPTAPTAADPVATARAQAYARINALRASASLPALATWADGEACANTAAQTDCLANAPHTSFTSCGESGQNDARGWTSVTQIPTEALQAMWDEGPGDFSTHGDYLNLASTSYHKVAVGIYTGSPGNVWAVLNFAP